MFSVCLHVWCVNTSVKSQDLCVNVQMTQVVWKYQKSFQYDMAVKMENTWKILSHANMIMFAEVDE